MKGGGRMSLRKHRMTGHHQTNLLVKMMQQREANKPKQKRPAPTMFPTVKEAMKSR